MPSMLRIGTRDSQLALWQADHIANLLRAAGQEVEIIHIKSDGEFDLKTPLYEMGTTGIFTKTLDIALLQNRIDIAVHSLKDVPTKLANGLTLAAVPARGNHKDLLAYKHNLPTQEQAYVTATSSLRRKAQWLNRFPEHKIENLRGNINTRLQKLTDQQHWDGALFAAVGVERIGLEIPNGQELDWMLPAPGQGALAVVCRADDQTAIDVCSPLNDKAARTAVNAERLFLRTLMGGCSMPIAAHAYVTDDQLHFKGMVLSIDGKDKVEVDLVFDENELEAGSIAAHALLDAGGRPIIQALQKLNA